ncbi:hypothetical protein GM418_17660 [Maribellus comscasis]|uniref:Uncharacterized protein n=1 Tax=Maribellus comscasis TaxID=2681766 RepID=A0A6I6JZ08_9BACT|nr:hypothetical protein [Maribellus comscasis]QGY45432.1 hypothetical protein GM418_17660 [Maribellus comscasis]
MKKLLFAFLACLTFVSCDKDDSMDFVEVDFVLKNSLLWNIGHDYYVSGIDESGNAFDGTEQYINYYNYLLQSQKVKSGSTLTLYRDSSILWTSDPIEESCCITYHDSAYDDWYDVE